MEIWKSLNGIVECGEYYEVSNLGRVRSVNRTIKYIDGRIRTFKGQLIYIFNDKNGYSKVRLSNNCKKKTYNVHKLVAIAFLENPNNYKCVNHKDENKHNNKLTNLEFCNHKFNNNYGTKPQRISESLKGEKSKISKQVIICKMNEDGSACYVATYCGIREIERKLNINSSNICDVLKGRRKHAKGYVFKYVEVK